MSVKDGGPAFPPMHDPESHPSGMSLRDAYAGQAMAAIIAKLPLFGMQSEAGDISIGVDTAGHDAVVAEVARGAFAYADAMLAERSKP